MENEPQEKTAFDKLRWSDFTPTHLAPTYTECTDGGHAKDQTADTKYSEPPAWSIPLKNRLGHASGRLPENPADCCMTWHPAIDSHPAITTTTTWARLAAKAHVLASITRREVSA